MQIRIHAKDSCARLKGAYTTTTTHAATNQKEHTRVRISINQCMPYFNIHAYVEGGTV